MASLPENIESAVRSVFEKNFRDRGEIGSGVALWRGGEELISLTGGFTNKDQTHPWDERTLVPVWSATKGPSAVSCLLALEEADLSLLSPVAEAWPEFAARGKAQITFAQVLSHTCGLHALEERPPILDYPAVIRALEQQAPAFPPGTNQGYQARTFGFLLDEIVRRLTKATSLGQYFRQKIGDPMGLDFWIGLPPRENDRVATLYPGRMRAGAAVDDFGRAFAKADSPTRRSMQSPEGLNAVHDFNRPETWALGFPAMGGIGSARALAQFYSMLANGGMWKGIQLVSLAVVEKLSAPLSQQVDLVLCHPMAFSAGMMMDPVDPQTGLKLRTLMGPSGKAFGHAGAGGSLAFADPERGLGFAYVMNQMELGVLPSEKAQDLVRALDGLA